LGFLETEEQQSRLCHENAISGDKLSASLEARV
jgi:hypothetical protein